MYLDVDDLCLFVVVNLDNQDVVLFKAAEFECGPEEIRTNVCVKELWYLCLEPECVTKVWYLQFNNSFLEDFVSFVVHVAMLCLRLMFCLVVSSYICGVIYLWLQFRLL